MKTLEITYPGNGEYGEYGEYGAKKRTEGRLSGFDLRKENQDNGQTVESAVS